MLLLPRSQVYPSGALFATSSAAILPPAPGRFSITICWAHDSASFWPRARARISLGPPGVKPTTKRTGFSGQPCAVAPPENATAMNKAAAMRLIKLLFADIILISSHKIAKAPTKKRTKKREKKNLKAAPQISPVMQALSAYIARALRRPLPPAVQEKTKHHLLDTLAAMLSGSRLPPGKKAISFAKTLGGAKEACVFGSRIVTAAANAARSEERRVGKECRSRGS